MLSALKFVQGAIKKKTHAPELAHYLIRGGRITGFNGYMALSSPIDLPFEARPNAAQFYRAIDTCGEVAALHMTPTGRLAVKSGKFKAFINCLEPGDVYDATPQGELVPAPAGLVKKLAQILPFVGDDASRPWAMGLLLRDGLAMATNNVTLVQAWTGPLGLPPINVPRYALAEMVRIKEDPVSLQSDGSSLTVHYENGRWMRTQLVDPEWPFDKLAALFSFTDDPQPITDELREAIARVTAFLESDSDPVYFARGGVASSTHEEEGVAQEVDGLPQGPIFGSRQIRLVMESAATADFTLYPRPCSFYDAERLLRGIVLGRNG